MLDLVQAARALRVSGGTAFAPAGAHRMPAARDRGLGEPGHRLHVGRRGQRRLPTLPCNPPVTFQTFAVGSGSSCTFGSAGRGLDDIAIKTGGVCRNVANPQDLPNILPEIIGSRITRLTYTLDDQPAVDISGQARAPAGRSDRGPARDRPAERHDPRERTGCA